MKRNTTPKQRSRRGNRATAILLCAMLCLSTLLFNVVNSDAFRTGFARGEGNPLDRIFSLLRDGNANPQTFADYEDLANIAIAQEQYEEALPYIDQCVALSDPKDTRTVAALLTRKGSVYALLSRPDEAVQCLDEALAMAPDTASALMLRAQIYIERGEFPDAAADLERYVAIEPGDASVWVGLAQLYEALSEFDKARACYDRSLALDGENAESLLNRARSGYLAGNYEDALSDYDEYLAEVGDAGGVARFLRGVCLMQMTRYEEAIEDILTALEDGYPDEALCYEQLSVSAYALERYEEVVAYGEKVLTFDGAQVSFDSLYQRMGVSRMGLGAYAEAASDITMSIDLNPDLEGNFYYRGVCNLALEAYDEAIADFTDSIALGFLTQFCYYNRGVCHVQKMDYASALDDMERTLGAGDDPDLITAARDVLWQMAQYYMNNPEWVPTPDQTPLPLEMQVFDDPLNADD